MQPGPPPWGSPQQPWGSPQQAWGPAPQPWSPPPPKKKNTTLLVVLLLLGFVGLPILVLLAAGGLVYWRARESFVTLDPKDVPTQMERHLPCKKTCRVTNITLQDGWFSVSVASDDVAGRTLLYRVYSHGAELGFSQDWGTLPATIEYREIDWSLATKLKKDLDREAINGKVADSVSIHPCDYSQKSAPTRACMEARVLTSRGDLKRIVDAKTGEVKESL